MSVTQTETDRVILLDDDGTPRGSAPRLEVHGPDTPLHQAFSLYVFDERGRVLITRRALSKRTWPGVWTNACCGHPRPDEPLEDAVRRRVSEELGLAVDDLQLVLPDFRYRAVDASGVVENEICPVFVARIDGEVRRDPDEVSQHTWVAWPDLVSAVRATPDVYSPWSAMQVPLLEAERSRLPLTSAPSSAPAAPPSRTGVEHTLLRVDEVLRHENAWIDHVWNTLAPAGPPDVLGDDPGDLPTWLHSLLVGGGKRIRPQMCHWGFIASGGRVGTRSHDMVVRAAAALETLHLFALIHDDVMDQSDERRGRPSAHVVATRRHLAADAHGLSARFGENIAILLGDLAHCEADRMVHTLPSEMRDFWYELNLELIIGQRADLTGAAAGRTDLEHAEAVAALKSGAYTIERPLQLGALAANATLEQRDALARYGRHLGRAFAWRDDVLGVWGDHTLTGKPSGDDLREGKTTLIWVLGTARLTGEAQAAMQRVGTPEARADDIPLLQRALDEAGVRLELERRIAAELEAADAVLLDAPLTADGVEGLRATARTIAWRDA
ncbi:isopentenyl-diphosphate Delta-isomerase [Ornithinimicrobium cerasi]|uniref:Isopentenyl-diphosphate Delta-isomerase n=1 Tax=Ornithinimicrobium cerasi TaxID=2248773 RepID=A0A285VVZ6_9MICO|nr:isopentenyl-diphosphate delta-isomerase [Ornithinimicrobium cerasi]